MKFEQSLERWKALGDQRFLDEQPSNPVQGQRWKWGSTWYRFSGSSWAQSFLCGACHDFGYLFVLNSSYKCQPGPTVRCWCPKGVKAGEKVEHPKSGGTRIVASDNPGRTVEEVKAESPNSLFARLDCDRQEPEVLDFDPGNLAAALRPAQTDGLKYEVVGQLGGVTAIEGGAF